MKVVPVIDILKDRVVAAVEGKREKYMPLNSPYCRNGDLFEILENYVELFGFDEVYVADLDSITSGEVNFEYLKEAKAKYPGLRVMIDAGVDSFESAGKIEDLGGVPIVATETLTSIENLMEIKERMGPDGFVLSVDVKDGQLLTKCKELASMDPGKAVDALLVPGIGRVLLIDLSRVGTRRGPVTPLLEEILKKGDREVFVGGGVKDVDDISALAEKGAAGALVATALHDGSLTPGKLKSFMKSS